MAGRSRFERLERWERGRFREGKGRLGHQRTDRYVGMNDSWGRHCACQRPLGTTGAGKKRHSITKNPIFGPVKAYFDLREFIVRQLLEQGILRSAIDVVGGCTYSNPDRYFSYRRDQGQTGRHLSYIMLSGSSLAKSNNCDQSYLEPG